MCSPVASIASQKGALWSYHLGRGISYISLGALGGLFGSYFLASELHSVRLYSGILFALILIIFGVRTYRGHKNFVSMNSRWLHSFYNARTPVLALGLLTVFLPCGWLYSYMLAAAATQSVLGGSLIMGLFWLGGLPALSSVSLLMGKTIHLAPAKKQKLASLVLISAGLYTLGSFYFLLGWAS
jgi:sulfite exporter TauE/SafE